MSTISPATVSRFRLRHPRPCLSWRGGIASQNKRQQRLGTHPLTAKQDDVVAARPDIDDKVAHLVSKGKWDVPGYKVCVHPASPWPFPANTVKQPADCVTLEQIRRSIRLVEENQLSFSPRPAWLGGRRVCFGEHRTESYIDLLRRNESFSTCTIERPLLCRVERHRHRTTLALPRDTAGPLASLPPCPQHPASRASFLRSRDTRMTYNDCCKSTRSTLAHDARAYHAEDGNVYIQLMRAQK